MSPSYLRKETYLQNGHALYHLSQYPGLYSRTSGSHGKFAACQNSETNDCHLPLLWEVDRCIVVMTHNVSGMAIHLSIPQSANRTFHNSRDST